MLNQIIEHKKMEVAQAKKQTSIQELRQKPLFEREIYSFKKSIVEGSGIIAEFKRKSPSKGVINNQVDVAQITQGYAAAGASALSVLTDEQFFGGKLSDLETARQHNTIPILRKDFMIDVFQLYQARAYGADVILLIAAALSPKECYVLAKEAKAIGLEVLLEVHQASELDEHPNEFVDVIGVNNRNLKTFDVTIEESIKLIDKIPSQFVKISESGLDNIDTILQLRQAGYQGFLMGEYFMKHQNPAQACRELITQLKKLTFFANDLL